MAFRRQHRLDLLNEGPQLSLGVWVLLQQVRPPPGPPPRQSRADQLHIHPGPGSELLARLLQPLLGHLSLLGVPAAQQLGVPALCRLPPVSGCGIYDYPASKHRQCEQALPSISAPLSDLSMGEQVRRLGLDNSNPHERGCSHGTVQAHLDRLRDRGVITRATAASSIGLRRIEACPSATRHRGKDVLFISAEAGM